MMSLRFFILVNLICALVFGQEHLFVQSNNDNNKELYSSSNQKFKTGSQTATDYLEENAEKSFQNTVSRRELHRMMGKGKGKGGGKMKRGNIDLNNAYRKRTVVGKQYRNTNRYNTNYYMPKKTKNMHYKKKARKMTKQKNGKGHGGRKNHNGFSRRHNDNYNDPDHNHMNLRDNHSHGNGHSHQRHGDMHKHNGYRHTDDYNYHDDHNEHSSSYHQHDDYHYRDEHNGKVGDNHQIDDYHYHRNHDDNVYDHRHDDHHYLDDYYDDDADDHGDYTYSDDYYNHNHMDGHHHHNFHTHNAPISTDEYLDDSIDFDSASKAPRPTSQPAQAPNDNEESSPNDNEDSTPSKSPATLFPTITGAPTVLTGKTIRMNVESRYTWFNVDYRNPTEEELDEMNEATEEFFFATLKERYADTDVIPIGFKSGVYERKIVPPQNMTIFYRFDAIFDEDGRIPSAISVNKLFDDSDVERLITEYYQPLKPNTFENIEALSWVSFTEVILGNERTDNNARQNSARQNNALQNNVRNRN